MDAVQQSREWDRSSYSSLASILTLSSTLDGLGDGTGFTSSAASSSSSSLTVSSSSDSGLALTPLPLALPLGVLGLALDVALIDETRSLMGHVAMRSSEVTPFALQSTQRRPCPTSSRWRLYLSAPGRSAGSTRLDARRTGDPEV